MRFSIPARLLGATCLIFFTACADQSEGERCDFNNSGDDDCESGLTCVQARELLDGSTDRCCPPEGAAISDDRCARSGPGTGGSAGAAGSAGSAGSSGASGSAGTSGSGGVGGSAGSSGSGGNADAGGCTHSSQCPGTEVCGPGGVCQKECLGNKDCQDGKTCNLATNTCETAKDAGTD